MSMVWRLVTELHLFVVEAMPLSCVSVFVGTLVAEVLALVASGWSVVEGMPQSC